SPARAIASWAPSTSRRSSERTCRWLTESAAAALEASAQDLPLWQYHTAGDDRVRPTHAVLNGLILPGNHEFWNDHFPPWSFNCRCAVTATDEIPAGYNHNNPSGDAEIYYDKS